MHGVWGITYYGTPYLPVHCNCPTEICLYSYSVASSLKHFSRDTNTIFTPINATGQRATLSKRGGHSPVNELYCFVIQEFFFRKDDTKYVCKSYFDEPGHEVEVLISISHIPAPLKAHNLTK